MKNKNLIIALTLLFFLIPFFVQAQDILTRINSYRTPVLRIAQAVISLGAIGGGLGVYFKLQGEEGGNGKKAVGSFILALIFGALFSSIIEFFIP